MIAWVRLRAWLEQRRQQAKAHDTANAALRLLRDAVEIDVVTQPAGALRTDPQTWILTRAMVAALRQDAAERETLDASRRLEAEAYSESDPLPHDPGRVDAARRASLLRLARRIELLRGCVRG